MIVAVALVAIGLPALYSRKSGARIRATGLPRVNQPVLDCGEDRETARLANMSAEDRDWETAALLRHQAKRERAFGAAQQG